jgi:ADP-ribose pyrophosphatase
MDSPSGNGARIYPVVPRVGVGAVVGQQHKMLMVRRGRPPAQGLWTLPGGLVELGESLEQALRREILEECGLRIESTSLLDVVEFIDSDNDNKIRYHYIVVDYLAKWIAGELQPATDVIAARWMTRAELFQIDLAPFTRRFINKHERAIWT